MKLPTLAELGTAKRGDPCREYPGTYLVYHNGNEVGCFVDMEHDSASDPSARALAYERARKLHEREEGKVSVCWEASHNDPRIGKVWFTNFYQLDEWK